ncbi:MAG TPA: DUF3467 domain-containing protein [Deinococcales bacterium]|nr:DUF3467 domain-containing protein [Deinococcales bacterium]
MSNQGKELKLDIDKETAKGTYSNMALISHTGAEFFVDFVLAYPRQQPTVTSRMILSPQHAKALLLSLQENVRRFESRFGEISLPQSNRNPAEQN